MHRTNIHQFTTREEAGRALAKRLAGFAVSKNVIVLALSNGGVAVGAEVAALLNKPFDILLVRKITAPEFGDAEFGAITAGGVRMLNSAVIDELHLSDSAISAAVLRESLELARREIACRGHQPHLEIADRTVILVDDGETSCATIRDAIRLLRRQHAERVIVALPAACRHATGDLRLEADEVVALAESPSRTPAGKWFKHFPRMSDDEVRGRLSGGARRAFA